MISVTNAQLPPQQADWISGRSLTTPAFVLIRSLYTRSGGLNGIINTSGSALTAAGASQTTALKLTNDFNEVTGGAGGTGVELAALKPGQVQVVFNGLASGNLNVFPVAFGQINALAVNAAYSLPNGKTQFFICYSLLASGAPLYRTVSLG